MQNLELSNHIKQIGNFIVKKNNCDYITIDLLNKVYNQDSKVFDDLFKINGYDVFLKNSVRKVFDILVSNLPNCYKKVLLYENLEYDFNNELTSYLLSLYATGSNKVYSDFPMLFYALMQKLKIYPFIHYGEDEVRKLMYKNFDFVTEDERTKILDRFLLNSEKYNKYIDSNGNKKNIDINDNDCLFVLSEYDEYDELLNKYGKDKTNHIMWLSRYYGDGFGGDFLIYNEFYNNEKVIEEKSGRNDFCVLTRNEYKTLKNTRNVDNSEYFIRKRNYFEIPGLNICCTCYSYNYDKEKDLLFLDNKREYYELLPENENVFFRKDNQNGKNKIIYLVNERGKELSRSREIR